MTVFECRNCRFRFQAKESSKCPRCDSLDVFEYSSLHARKQPGAPEAAPQASAQGQGQPAATVPQPIRAVREGKEGWRDFHNQQATNCPECGGVEFDLNWKRKEKTCKKCGAVLPLPRRFS